MQARVARVLLDAREGDAQLGTPVRRFRVEQVGGGAAEGLGEVVDEREPRLALAVLDLGEVGGLSPDERTELVQRQVTTPAEVAEPLAEDERVEAGGIHE